MGMKKWWIPICGLLVVLLLSSCAVIDAGKNALVNKGAELSQKALDDSEFFVCRLAPIGSIIDRYGQTDERAGEYKDFCNTGSNDVNIVAPE